MKDVIHALAGGAHRREVAHVGLAKVDLGADLLEVCQAAGRQVIHPAHLGALRQQRPCNTGPDKAGYAGNQCTCHTPPVKRNAA